MSNLLLSTAYLPPVEYVSAIATRGNFSCQIDACETYLKQTYRTRAHIASPNGLQVLTIPIKKEVANNCPITQIHIDNSEQWQRRHWRALETAYNASPYFLYFKDYLQPFYEQRFDSLIDFNTSLLRTICRLLKWKVTINYTTDFLPPTEANPDFDLRYSITPKAALKKDYIHYMPPTYQQVFETKYGRLPNLSVVDALFNAATLKGE